MLVFKKVGDIFCICHNHMCLSRYWHILKDKKIKYFAVLGCVLYGTLSNLIYKDEMVFCSFLFVCFHIFLYLIQIHISEPISTEHCTRLPLCLGEVVGYVWTHNI